LIVSWYSAGVSSLIATYLTRDILDQVIYNHIKDQHPDTMRFLADSEKLLGGKIDVLMSPYESVSNVIETFRYINGPYGAKCTDVLKRRVRKEWEYGKKDLTYIWGYDLTEKHRADRIVESMPDQQHIFPLIERGLKKEDCHGMARQLQIKRPIMYDMGYRNNNCIGCVKGSMWYWNKIRIDYPEVFAERARQEREIGHTCIQGIYLDELDPNRGRIQDEVMEECSIICQLGGM